MGHFRSASATGTGHTASRQSGRNRATNIASIRRPTGNSANVNKQSSRLPATGAAKELTEADYERAAASLGTNIAFVKAVADVESRGTGFLKNGRPKILFEAHLFSRLTSHKYDKLNAGISSRKWNKSLYTGGSKEYSRLQNAMELNRDAALKSASWGKFQILGSHYHNLGYKSVDAFVVDMFHSEGKQLDAFVAFIKADARLLKAAHKRDWASFAAVYNGPGYKKNKYDSAMEHAYAKHMNEAKKKSVSMPNSAAGPVMTKREGQGPTQSLELKPSDYLIKPNQPK